MKEFEFYEPKTVEDACSLLAKFRGRARPMAGGTDLLVELKSGRLNLAAAVNLKKIKGLNRITFTRKQGLSIGALVTWTQLLESKPVSRHYPLLKKAAETMGSMQIRNVGTLAGNLAHSSPAAAGPIPLLIYEAECVAHGPNGERVFPVEKLFGGVQRNTLRSGEILIEIRVPPPPPGMHGTYHKFSLRRAMDLAVVGVGALVGCSDGTFDEVRVALGSVAPKPFRARRAEKALLGKAIEDQVIHDAAQKAAADCAPITDIRASGEYRIELVKELTFRAIKESIV
jgi:carbon-monoxide dehydrogenase medium subunit